MGEDTIFDKKVFDKRKINKEGKAPSTITGE